MVFETTSAAVAFLVGRVLFGGVLAFMGLNHFGDVDGMAAYAESKGVPAGRLMVVLSGLALLAGGLAVAAGAYPVVGAGLLAVFLVVTTPVMHDFWAVGEDQRESEMTNFLKNVALLGAALAVAALGTVEWPYAVGLGLFS